MNAAWPPPTAEETKQIAPYVKAVQDILYTAPFTEPDELPVQLLSWLYLSDMDSVQNASVLLELGITHVLTTNETRDCELQDYQRTTDRCVQEHLIRQGKDEAGYDMIGQHWIACRDFLLRARQGNPQAKVVVHCAAGLNRSALIAAAALLLLNNDIHDGIVNNSNDTSTMTTEEEENTFLGRGLGLLDVVRYVKAKRGIVLVNKSFQEQLCLLALRENRLEREENA